MWAKLSKKLHCSCRKKKRFATSESMRPSSVVIISKPPTGNQVQDSAEKHPVSTKIPNPDTQPPEQHDNSPTRDLWREAFQRLPETKQKRLEDMGFDRPFRHESVMSAMDDLVHIVNEKQKECEEKFWHVSFGDKDVVLRDYTSRIIYWVQKAGDIAVQFAPSAGGPWAIVKACLQIPVVEGEQMAALMGVTEKIVRIMSRGQVYEQIYLHPTTGVGALENGPSKSLRNALIKIYTSSLDLLAESEDLFSKSTARRTLRAVLDPGSVSSSLSALTEQENSLSQDVQACEAQRSATVDSELLKKLDAINSPLSYMNSNVQQLLNGMDKHQHIQLLQWISPVLFGDHHANVKETRAPGTAEWLLQHRSFRNWESSDSSGIFWLQGSPGTGKTYITSRVIDLFQGTLNEPPRDEGFAFFYCDKNEGSRQKAHSILRSYVRQLSTTPSSPQCIRTKLRLECERAQSNGSSLSIKACQENIFASVTAYPKTTLVIDALDECTDSRDELVDTLNALVSESRNTVKIFISSRPDTELQNMLKGYTGVVIEADHSQVDIRNFLELELKQISRKVPFIQPLESEITEKLLEQCQGMFLLASLQLNRVEECRTKQGVLEELEKLPKHLYKAYDSIWDKIETLPEYEKVLTKRALSWVMAATKPLGRKALLSAVRVRSKLDEPFLNDEIDEQGLLALCKNFLVIDTQLQVWRFSHISVMEYLDKHHWSLAQAHSHAAISCLSFFIEAYENEPTTVADIPEFEGHQHEAYDLFDTMDQFHVYIRHHWAIHVHGSSEQSTVGILLKTFLGEPDKSSTQYRRWFAQVKNDSFAIRPLIDDSSGWDISGFDNSVFDFFKSARKLAHPSQYEWGSELEPEDVSIFAMCRFAFDEILWDWWETKEIDINRLNQRGHNLLTIAAIGGSVQICERLIAAGTDVNFLIKTNVLEPYMDYGSALVAAAHKGQKEVVNCLIRSGADVNISYRIGQGCFESALEAAIDGGGEGTFECLYLVDANATYETFMAKLSRRARFHIDFTLERLEKAGFDLTNNFKDSWYLTSLLTAAYGTVGRFKIFRHLVRKEPDSNMFLEGHFGSVLEAAAFFGYIDIVEYLIESEGADVNMTTSHGYGSVLTAAIKGLNLYREDESSMQTLKYLIQQGADVNQTLRCGKYGSPLAAAAEIPDIQFLLEAGADVNMPLTQGDYGSALTASAVTGNIEIVKLLLKAGADPNMRCLTGDYGSPLAAAAAMATEDLEVMECLLKAGADPNMLLPVGIYGSALIAAAARNEPAKVKLLLESGADPNMKCPTGEYGSALVAAAAFMSDVETIQHLLSAGADVNMLVPSGKYGSALIAASTAGDPESVQSLLDAGADANMHCSIGDYGSPLVAAASGDAKAGTFYLSIFTNQVRFRGTSNYETFMGVGACNSSEHVAIVELLLKAGADPNLQVSCSEHGNALAAAAFCGSMGIMKMLIDAGADINASSVSGRFPSALTASIGSDILYRSFVLNHMVEALLDRMKRGLDESMPFRRNLYKEFLVAATRSMKNAQFLEFLIEAGADVNQTHPKTEYGSALIAAAHFGHYDLAKCLIEKGAAVNLCLDSPSFATALQAAHSVVTKEDKRRIRYYCEDDGYMAEEVRYLEERRAGVAELLLEHGATA